MSRPSWRDLVEGALRLDRPYAGRGRGVRMPPRDGDRPDAAASVLLMLGFPVSAPGADPRLLLTVRSQAVETHKGQISFPGGMIDAGESVEQAALREAEEEIGLAAAEIQLIGRLPELPTLTTGFRVTPVVGLLVPPVEEAVVRPHAAEVEQAFWVPLEELRGREARKMETYRVGEVDYPTPAFYWGGHRIWGATAAVIWNFLDRIEEAGG